MTRCSEQGHEPWGHVENGEYRDQLFDYEERSVLTGVSCQLSVTCALHKTETELV